MECTIGMVEGDLVQSATMELCDMDLDVNFLQPDDLVLSLWYFLLGQQANTLKPMHWRSILHYCTCMNKKKTLNQKMRDVKMKNK